ncbi:glycosyltransferase family 9 protein [Polynucleobacter sp. 71A-WALBACH]|uniref:glycosyltransferase family 9 protein n=1 Tax=Polynucleobacter sp. 71A-WALBACH TaxID=2689097 RepID=UPI001C0D7DCD|nr:glycosyltransferase family 9 protein [Polynucleobacter sp. 71A-WALBACH]MBU3593264.1 glycosyltransferase family 9 protein [Polynucleobacter sp. 71A-WALBACH]
MKITLVKLGGIGDIVQLSTALFKYRQDNPDLKLDFVTSKSFSDLVQAFGVADRVIAVDDKKLFFGNYLYRLINLLAASLKIATFTYNSKKIITAYVDWRYRLLTMATFWVPCICFLKKGNDPQLIQGRNRVFEYLSLISQESLPKIDVAKVSDEFGAHLLSGSGDTLKKFNLYQAPFVTLIPGGAKNLLRDDGLRRWPVNHYKELAINLIALGERVVIAGGPEDIWVREAFKGLPVIDIIGKTSIIELVHIFSQARLVISHDTGPIHLASLTKAPLIGLFGPTPINAVIPLGRAKTVGIQLGNRISCSPCYDGRSYAECSNARCMKEISPEQVLVEAKSLLPKTIY